MAIVHSHCSPKRVYDSKIATGVIRTIGEPETPGYVDPAAAAMDAEVEQFRQQRREAAIREYAEKIRQGEISVEDRERFNAEFGLTGARIVSDREALEQEARLLKVLAEPDADFDALETKASEADADAKHALVESIADLFRKQSIETIVNCRRRIWEMFPHLANSAMGLPERQDASLMAAAHDALSALRYAHEKKPRAESELRSLHQANRHLWPD